MQRQEQNTKQRNKHLSEIEFWRLIFRWGLAKKIHAGYILTNSSISNLLDHKQAIIDDKGISKVIGEPYQIFHEDLRVLIKLVDAFNLINDGETKLVFVILGRSEHNPGATLRIEIWEQPQ